jgi:hypothetical protein
MGVPFQEIRSTLASSDPKSIASAIVNIPFKYRADMVLMGIGIIVLLIADKKCGQIHRVALSNTELAEGTTRISSKKFEEIMVPIDDKQNIVAKAIKTQQPQMTDDWKYLFTPGLSPDQARLNQAGGGIACSHVYPLSFQGEGGALIFSFFKGPEEIGKTEVRFMDTYSKAVSDRLDTTENSHAILLNKTAND